MTYKQMSKYLGVSLATVYRYYPIKQPQATQADAVLLRIQGYPIRTIALVLGVTKDRVWRWVR